MSLLGPLRHRDFRLLWSGMCVSLLGDGVFLVAMAWQVYSLSDAPTALSLVGVAMAAPTIALLLLGGVVSDRVDRRRAMLAADLARGLAVATLAALSLSGGLRLWHVVAIVGLYGDKCAVCHGEDGAGKTAKGKKLKVQDVRDTVKKMSEADMIKVVTNGKDPDMDAFGKELKADQIQVLVTYYRSLAVKK